jgi:RHS repeat-associated protein
VTSAGGNTYSYDLNGTQTTRVIGTDTFTLLYDAENRLVEVKKNSVTMAQFTFDGDGRRVKSVIDGTTTYFAGGHYELTGSTVTKYYFAGSQRIAMRKYTIPQSMSVEYLLGDHLGSTSITTDANGVKVSEMRYKPWGEIRYTWTSAPATTPAYKLPNYTYASQYSYMDDPTTAVTEGFGLMFYVSRFYDPALGRFAQADTIVPGGVQGLDRYAYVNNDPVRYTDPSGHVACDENGVCTQSSTPNPIGNPTKYIQEYKDLILKRFGITLSGNWDLQNARGMFNALITMDKVIPGGIAIFTRGSTYSFQHSESNYGGRANNTTGDIAFWSYRQIPYQNIYHEVAHSIDIRSGEYFTRTLAAEKIYTASRDFVMGGSSDNYIRNSLGYAESMILDPTGAYVEAEQHTATFSCGGRIGWCQSGNNANEEFADLVANYVSNNFDLGSQFGIARHNWVVDIFTTYLNGSMMP